ncbi:MAG TPA: cupin domain-containing protein [Solirubrobacterales bacterium]|nr:cupin domain-containing protein [Solirubrobacterales bacterium]
MLTNPFTGQTLERQSEDDEVLVMETTYAAGGAPAPAHFHPAQDEHFVVISGAVRTVVDGEERILREGDELIVPAGTPHEFGGHPDEAARVRWEVRPPLRTWEFFEGMFGLLQAHADGRGDEADFDVAAYDDVFRLA